MFVELHMIQNFAPSCLNRDDTNAPKDCEFGGYRRARISSQCLKRAIRMNPEFSKVIGQECSNRTKLVPITPRVSSRICGFIREEARTKVTAIPCGKPSPRKRNTSGSVLMVGMGEAIPTIATRGACNARGLRGIAQARASASG